MDLLTLLAIFCLLIVAVAFSPLGLGGGILYVPIMHYMLDWEMKEAIVVSLTLVLMVSLGSSLAHSKSGFANKEVAKLGRISAIPSAIIGVILSGLLISAVGDVGIKIIAVIIILFIIDRTIRMNISKNNIDGEEINISERKNEYLIGTSFAGLSSGILGIGGGAILVTLNRSILKMDAKKSAGTSYLITSTIVPVALLSHLLISNNLDTIVESSGIISMIIIPVMVLISSYLGAKYAIKHLPKQLITFVFLFVILLSLLKYISDLITLV